MALDLDERQRGMLEEMGIRVWAPRPAVATPAETVPVQGAGPAAAAARTAAPARPVARPLPAAEGARPETPAPQRVPAAPGGTLPGNTTDMDWPALAEAVSSCTACGLCEGRKTAVFVPEPAPRQVDWLVVGEPPDADEERAAAPFMGKAGQLLDNMLRAVQVARDGAGRAGARLTPVVKCRPAAVRNPQAAELATCAHYLRREIALSQPRVILVMGRFAAHALLGLDNPELSGVPFARLRGQVHRYQGVPVVVTYHPTLLLRSPEYKAAAWADLCLARSVAYPGEA